jgi:hypothetical protein
VGVCLPVAERKSAGGSGLRPLTLRRDRSLRRAILVSFHERTQVHASTAPSGPFP